MEEKNKFRYLHDTSYCFLCKAEIIHLMNTENEFFVCILNILELFLRFKIVF